MKTNFFKIYKICVIIIVTMCYVIASDVLYIGIPTESERNSVYQPQHSLSVVVREIKETTGTATFNAVNLNVSSQLQIEGRQSSYISNSTNNTLFSSNQTISASGGSNVAVSGGGGSVDIKSVLTGWDVGVSYTGVEDLGAFGPVFTKLFNKAESVDCFVDDANKVLGLFNTKNQIYTFYRANHQDAPCPCGCCCGLNDIAAYSSPDIEKSRCQGKVTSCFLGGLFCSNLAELICVQPFFDCESLDTWRLIQATKRRDALVKAMIPFAKNSDTQAVAMVVKQADEIVEGRLKSRKAENERKQAEMIHMAALIRGSSVFPATMI